MLRAIVERWTEQFVVEHDIAVLKAAEEEERALLRSFLQRTGNADHELATP